MCFNDSNLQRLTYALKPNLLPGCGLSNDNLRCVKHVCYMYVTCVLCMCGTRVCHAICHACEKGLVDSTQFSTWPLNVPCLSSSLLPSPHSPSIALSGFVGIVFSAVNPDPPWVIWTTSSSWKAKRPRDVRPPSTMQRRILECSLALPSPLSIIPSLALHHPVYTPSANLTLVPRQTLCSIPPLPFRSTPVHRPPSMAFTSGRCPRSVTWQRMQRMSAGKWMSLQTNRGHSLRMHK